jgi:hypothetical protein
MKINDIEKLNEIPASGVGQLAKKAGAKVLSKVPSSRAKSKAANLAGKVNLGSTANLLHKQFAEFLGNQNKNVSQATGEDLQNFLQTKKHKTLQTIPSGVLQKQQLDDILMKVAQEAFTRKKGAGETDPDAEDPAGQATPAEEPKVQFTAGQQVAFKSNAGKLVTAKVVGKSMDGDEKKVAVNSGKQDYNISRDKLLDPATQKPFKASAPGVPSKPQQGIPKNIQAAINKLSPEEKQQLVKML